MPLTKPVGDLFAWHRAVVGQVSVGALGLVLVLSKRMNMDGTIPARFAPGLDTLAADCQFSASSGRKSVTRLIRELENAGYLRVTRTGGGRHVTNHYIATVPLNAAETVSLETQNDEDDTVSPGAQKDLGTVSPEAGNCVSGGTLPSLPSQSPSQGSGTRTAEPREHKPEHANRVMHVVANGLPEHEAAALFDGLPKLKQRGAMACRIDRLVDDGWEAELIEELTRLEADWSPSPYGGCPNAISVAKTAAARVRKLDKQLSRPKVDTGKLIQFRAVGS